MTASARHETPSAKTQFEAAGWVWRTEATEAQTQATDHSFQSKTVRMSDGGGPPDERLNQSRRQGGTYYMTYSRTRRGSGGRRAFQLETREILWKARRMAEATHNTVVNEALLNLYHRERALGRPKSNTG